MQIHELNNFTGTLGSGAYLAVDDGNDTGKLSTQQLLAATEARIDNIIAGPAPSAQEVTDARRGADGVTYSSLGTSIRSQVTDLKSALKGVVNIDGVAFEYGNIVGGQPVYETGRIRSVEMIPVSVGVRITFRSVPQYTGMAVILYDANGVYQDGIGWLDNYTVQIDGYVRIILKKPNDATISTEEFETLRSNVSMSYNAVNTYGKLTTEIDNVEELAVSAKDATQTFKGLGNFQHYGLQPDGSFLLDQQYRVSNNDQMTFDRDITVSVNSGFRWGYMIFKYDDPVWSGWFTDKTMISAGTSFIVQIARTSEISSEIADVDEFLNQVKFDTAFGGRMNDVESVTELADEAIGLTINADWEQGGLYEGAETTDNARIRTADFYEMGDSLSIALDLTFRATVHQYDSSKRFVKATPWTVGQFEIQRTDDVKYFRIAVSTIYDSTISTDSSSVIRVINKFKNLGVRVENLERASERGANQYIGEKIPSKVNSFDYANVMQMSYSDATAQDIEIHGDYLFVAFSRTEMIKAYSLSDGTLLATMPVSDHHGGGMQFSNEYYQSSDEFPLLYVGGFEGNIIDVIRITHTESQWNATVVKTITIPETEGYHLIPSIDAEKNILYGYGYKIDSIYPSANNGMVLVECDLSQLTDNGDNSFTPLVINRIETPYMGITQGRKYYNGRLYVGFANTEPPHNARLVSIDVSNGRTMADIDMTAVTQSECEGLCYRIVGNDITWYYSDYFNIYKLMFY